MAGSRWVRLDVDYFTNPKIMGLHPDARALHLASICWSAGQLTDGQIENRSLTYLGQIAHIDPKWVRRRARQLVDRGLWVITSAGWVIHDFETMNPQAMRKMVESEREKWREQKRRQRS